MYRAISSDECSDESADELYIVEKVDRSAKRGGRAACSAARATTRTRHARGTHAAHGVPLQARIEPEYLHSPEVCRLHVRCYVLVYCLHSTRCYCYPLQKQRVQTAFGRLMKRSLTNISACSKLDFVYLRLSRRSSQIQSSRVRRMPTNASCSLRHLFSP